MVSSMEVNLYQHLDIRKVETILYQVKIKKNILGKLVSSMVANLEMKLLYQTRHGLMESLMMVYSKENFGITEYSHMVNSKEDQLFRQQAVVSKELVRQNL